MVHHLMVMNLKTFADYLGFKHRRITPCWPRANGEAERLVQTLEKSIRITHLEGKNWKQELYKFLRQYRATPHSTTSVSPSEALNNRKLKTTIPELPLTNVIKSKVRLRIHQPASPKEMLCRSRKWKSMLIWRHMLKKERSSQEKLYSWDNPNKTSLAPPTIQSLLLWKRRKVPWSQRVMDHSLSQEILPNSKLFQNLAQSQEKTPGMQQNPPETKEDIPLRRSNRQIKPPVRFSDYVQVIYVK